MLNKKVFIILGIVILLIIVVLTVLYIRKKHNTESASNSQSNSNSSSHSNLPTAFNNDYYKITPPQPPLQSPPLPQAVSSKKK